MIKVAEIKEDDDIVDLGCGDGKILYLAEKNSKAKSYTGYEIAPMPILFFYIKKIFRKTKIKLLKKSYMKADLSKYSVVFVYLMPETLEKLLPKFRNELKKGSRVISNTFTIKNIENQKTFQVDEKSNKITVYYF